jgi:hypothetical protein
MAISATLVNGVTTVTTEDAAAISADAADNARRADPAEVAAAAEVEVEVEEEEAAAAALE